jgi:hypothetical protein
MPKITNEQIKEGIKEAYEMLHQHDAQRNKIIAEIEYWEDVCEHTNKFRVSHCGELAWKCKVCGKEF